jgi:prevent-host-death family protein
MRSPGRRTPPFSKFYRFNDFDVLDSGLNQDPLWKRGYMNLCDTIIPISEAKTHTARLINSVSESRSPVFITQNGRARVVVEDIQTYEETRETLALLKLMVMGRQDVAAGQFKPVAAAFAGIRKRIVSSQKP